MVVSWAYNAGTTTATASGVYTADASGTQIVCGGKIIVGDGTNITEFTDTNKQVIWINTSVGSSGTAFFVNNKSSATFGTLTDAATYRTSAGCTLLMLDTTLGSNSRFLRANSETALIYLYSCLIISNNGLVNGYSKLVRITRIWNSNLNGSDLYLWGLIDIDIYNVTATKCNSLGYQLTSSSKLKRIVFYDAGNTAFYLEHNNVAKDVILVNENKTANAWGPLTGYGYLVNVISSKWAFAWQAGSTGKIYRQYTFDLAVFDDAGAAINGATCVLKDKDGTQVFSQSTDASGVITQQTVTRGYYAQATGNTLQEYSPHTLTVTKTGYIPYTQKFTLSEQTDWTITLHDQLAGDASEADVATGKTFYSTDADTIQTGTYTPEPPGGGFYFPVEKKVTVEKTVEKPLNKTLLLLSSNLILQKWKLKRALLLENMLTAQKINKLTENKQKGK